MDHLFYGGLFYTCYSMSSALVPVDTTWFSRLHKLQEICQRSPQEWIRNLQFQDLPFDSHHRVNPAVWESIQSELVTLELLFYLLQGTEIPPTYAQHALDQLHAAFRQAAPLNFPEGPNPPWAVLHVALRAAVPPSSMNSHKWTLADPALHPNVSPVLPSYSFWCTITRHTGMNGTVDRYQLYTLQDHDLRKGLMRYMRHYHKLRDFYQEVYGEGSGKNLVTSQRDFGNYFYVIEDGYPSVTLQEWIRRNKNASVL